VAGITAIIGGGYGKNFDISKVRWDKIISAADADSAGNHINALLLLMVLRMYPQLIEAGKFYRAVPPLFMAKVGKKNIYFTDKASVVEYVQRLFSKANTITTLKGKKLTNRDVQELLYINYDYISELTKVADDNCIFPEILELYLYNRNLTPEKICSVIKKKYRFMEKVKINSQIVCDGIAEGVSNTLFMGDELLAECKEIISILDNNMYLEYMVNGKRSSILDIMRLYDASSPSNINRLKGLGEQSGEELAETVILPGDMGNRTLVRYTISSAMEEIEKIRFYNNNKNRLLDNLVVTKRDIAD
jgi:DNA gyrase/topoisomerase IV subunit B